jgi:NitT/TauT family transport system permease protein
VTDTAETLTVSRSLPSRRWRAARRSTKIVAPLGVAVALILLWELVVQLGFVSQDVLPSPVDVAERMVDRADTLLPQTWVTLKEMVIGFAIAAAAGLLLAVAMISSRRLELTLYPLLVGSQVIPKIAIAPVIFIWFGLGFTSRTIVVVVLSFFPIVVAATAGLKAIDRNVLFLARSVGASRTKQLIHFRIPQALPEIFSGLKVAATRAAGAAIIAEYITPGDGLGRTIFLATAELRPDLAMAGVAYLAIIGVGFYFLVATLERIAIPWHISNRGGSS